MLAAAPLAALAALVFERRVGASLSVLSLGAALGSGAALAVASWLGVRHDRWAASLATVGVAAASAASAPALSRTPHAALLFGLVAVGLVFFVWRAPARPRYALAFRAPRSEAAAAARAAAGGAIVAWVAAVGARAGALPWGPVLAGVSEVVAVAYALRWALLTTGTTRRLALGLLGVAAAAAAVALAVGNVAAALSAGVLPALGALAVASARRSRSGPTTWGEIFNHHARLLVVTFLILCIVGTTLLSLPACSADGRRIPLVDAAFTSVSAVCVTGLIVRDTPVDFSRLGQGIIMFLIQVGGLGIMTFATAAIGLLGRRMSLRQERAAAELLSERNRAALFDSLRRTMVVTFGVELVCAPVLAVWFTRYGDGALQAVWRGLFTAVSAFCNAGFALQSTNLIPYQSSGVIIHVVALLIIAGGLSPVVIARIPGILRGQRPDLRTSVILATTGALLAVGFVMILALEWGASLHGLSFWDKVNNAWFQSVTPRTAGFNSVDLGLMRPATLTILVVLMFIGGSPGGTAGGIKTTTFFVLAMAITSTLRGRWEISAFRRRIPHSTVYRAAAIATLGVLAVVAGLVALQVTQRIPTQVAMFEVVSALGTVGLSTGATPLLDSVGKIVIMACMFLGRVGPLTAFLFLYDHRVESSWRLPEEDLELG